MFKRLRVRFIALSMASLLLVLAVILGAVNLISYRHIVQETDATGMVEFPLSAVVEETAQSFRSRAIQKNQAFIERIAGAAANARRGRISAETTDGQSLQITARFPLER